MTDDLNKIYKKKGTDVEVTVTNAVEKPYFEYELVYYIPDDENNKHDFLKGREISVFCTEIDKVNGTATDDEDGSATAESSEKDDPDKFVGIGGEGEE